MRCSSAGSICHSPFSSLATEIFPALIARRIAVLFRPTAAAAVAMVCMGCCLPFQWADTVQPPWLKKRVWGQQPALRHQPFLGGVGAQAVILKSETYNLYRLDLTRQAGFIVTIYDEDGLKLAATMPFSTPAEAFAEARKIVDNKVDGPSLSD